MYVYLFQNAFLLQYVQAGKKVIFADLKLNVLTFCGFLSMCVQQSQTNVPVRFHNKLSNFTITIK